MQAGRRSSSTVLAEAQHHAAVWLRHQRCRNRWPATHSNRTTAISSHPAAGAAISGCRSRRRTAAAFIAEQAVQAAVEIAPHLVEVGRPVVGPLAVLTCRAFRHGPSEVDQRKIDPFRGRNQAFCRIRYLIDGGCWLSLVVSTARLFVSAGPQLRQLGNAIAATDPGRRRLARSTLNTADFTIFVALQPRLTARRSGRSCCTPVICGMASAPISSSTAIDGCYLLHRARGSAASTTCSSRSAWMVSSSVARKARHQLCGRSRMKPTVSDTTSAPLSPR